MSAGLDSLRDALKRSIEQVLAMKKPTQFKQSVELIIVFPGVNPKQPEFRFRDSVRLPSGLGKEVKVCIVADGAMATQAREAGAHCVITKDELTKMNRKEAKKVAQDCDWVLVQADLMGLAGRILGPALGPRGKAPTPVPPNADIKALIEQYKKTTRLRNKDQPWVGCRIGTENMPVEALVENALAVLQYVENKIHRPLANFAQIYIKTTMGPAIEVM